MANRKEDLRIRRTHKLLRDAMQQLLTEKSLDDISVVEICDRAMVHRATFYKHFADKYEFMEYVIKEVLEEFYTQSIVDRADLTPREMYRRIAQHTVGFVESCRTMIRVAARSSNNNKFFDSVSSVVSQEIRKLLIATSDHRPDMDAPPDIIAQFLAGGLINLIRWWVSTENSYSGEDIVEFIEQMIFSSRRGSHMSEPVRLGM